MLNPAAIAAGLKHFSMGLFWAGFTSPNGYVCASRIAASFVGNGARKTRFPSTYWEEV
jgi:hypothetical protein